MTIESNDAQDHHASPAGPRSRHGFRRTTCGCALCRAYCRHVPGRLEVGDLERLCPPGRDLFAWAREHLRAVVGAPGPRLVPARRYPGGPCHWHLDGACLVHADAPYGCAFFDAHMSAREVARRSRAADDAIQEDAAQDGPYAQVWRYLHQLGLTTESGDRAALERDMARLRGDRA